MPTARPSLAWLLLLLAACGGGAPDARYPAREAGCPVKSLPGRPPCPVDDLGVVTVECARRGAGCERQLLDAVCARGGDVAWGTADNALDGDHARGPRRAHERVTQGPRERGCAVQVFADAPPDADREHRPGHRALRRGGLARVCLRELQDQVCLLGGDVALAGRRAHAAVGTQNGTRQRMRGRAAHTKYDRRALLEALLERVGVRPRAWRSRARPG